MIFIKINRLFYLFGILVFLCLPFLVLILNVEQTSYQNLEFGIPSNILPLMIVIECLIYFFFGALSGSDLSTMQLIQYSISLAFFRFLMCLGGSVFFTILQGVSQIKAIQLFWAGNPLLVLLQVFLLMLFAPHLILLLYPGLMGEKERLLLIAEGKKPEGDRSFSLRLETTPMGGFIRVYSFKELGHLFTNLMGLEGYILYTREGLILWQDCQLRLDAEKLVVCFQKEWNCHRSNQIAIGFDEPERIITQTAEHTFLHAAFHKDFSGIFIFRPDTPIGDILSRFKYLERTAKEFLESRYSPVV